MQSNLLNLWAFLFCSNCFPDTEQLSSKNVLVIDGDTIILDKKKIRFSGIDAQESFFRGKKQTCKLESQKIFCGEISKKKLIIKHAKEKLGNPQRRCPNITKIKKLGYRPKINLKEGLKKTFEWYLKEYKNEL